jgi:protein TonB
MPPGRRYRARLGALLFMVGGCGLVFLAIFLMNAHSQPPKKEKRAYTALMEVKKEKKKPRPERQRRQRPKPKAVKAPRAPLPELSSAISQADLGIPTLDVNAVMGATAGVVGAESVENLVMSEETVDVPPRPRVRSAPEYPARARSKGQEGYVTLRVLIGLGGNVEKIKIVDSSPSGVFDDAAADAVRGWQFDPALYRGEKVKVWAKQVVRFKLG